MSIQETSFSQLALYLARIRRRLAFWTLLIMAPVVIALSIWGYNSAAHSLHQLSDQQLLDRATLISYDIDTSKHRIDAAGYLSDTRLSHTDWLVYIANMRGDVISGPRGHGIPWIVPAPIAFSQAIRDGNSTTPISLDLQGSSYRAVTVPIYDGNHVIGAVQAAAPTSQLDNQINRLQLIQILGTLLALVVAAGGGIFLAYRASRPIEEAAGQQQRFTNDAAHDLRTPITIIRGQADVALRNEQNESALRDALRHIRDEAEHLSTLVDHLLMLARTEAHGIELRRERFVLDELAIEVSRRAAPAAEARGVALRERGTTQVEVVGDIHRLEQALLNCVDNALKYTDPGGTITIQVGEEDKAGWIEVADTGCGIAADQLALVGQRFHRDDKRVEPEERRRGSGLGLAIARQIAELHGGRLSMASVKGEGTRVRLYLPRA